MTEVLSRNKFSILDDESEEIIVPVQPIAVKKVLNDIKIVKQIPGAKPIETKTDKPKFDKDNKNATTNSFNRNANSSRGRGGKPMVDRRSGAPRAEGEQQREFVDRRSGAPRADGEQPREFVDRRHARDGEQKRDFDRRSGSGRVDGEKKQTTGKGNWGKPIDNKIVDETVAQVTGEETNNETPQDIAQPEPETVEKEEEEENVMTLDQYFASRKKGPSVPTVSRLPNEGADSSQWKNVTPITIKDESFIVLGSKEKNQSANKSKNQKQFIEIEPRFSESSNRGGYGGQRKSYSSDKGKPRINMKDIRAFPSLAETLL